MTDTVLGANTQVKGTLRSRGNVHLGDIFEGEILSGGAVRVARSATLDGDLFADTAVVAGLVRGNIIARTIRLLETGKVIGNLRSEKLITTDGAQIQGAITLEDSLDPMAVADQREAGGEST